MKKLWMRVFDAWVAEVRREARKRALDELVAVPLGSDIGGGIGADVKATHWAITRQLIPVPQLDPREQLVLDNIAYAARYRMQG